MGKDKAPKPVEDDGVDFGPAKKAGKGHRQRGAGTVITAKAPVVTGDGILLKAHERLPVQLLQEFCQREKRPKAVFHKEGPGRRMRVLLPDAKNNKNDLVFCPSATDFESDAVARDYAALLALFHFQKSLPLERKLPEPYSTTWKQMLTADKESSSNSSSNSKRTRETKAETSANSKASALVKEEVETDVNNTKVGIAGKDAPIPTAALATPVLDKATADWMCDACASQNYATLASGQPRTKCFRCQKQKSDSCVLVASTSNQATKQSSGAKAPPAPILNLTASNKYISKAEAVQAKLQRRAESKRKSTYFEAVRKANKPMTVYLSTKLRNLLEDALGLSSKSNKMSAVNSIEDVLAILPEKGLVFPQDVCYLNADMQSILLEDVFDDLHYKGFKKSDVYDAFVEIFENKISDISDSFEETIGSIDDATSNDNEFETKLKEAYKQQLQEALTAQLCISLDESDLPVSFRSSAENKLKFEVMKNPSRGNQAKADDQSVATVTDPTASTLEQYGWRYDACVAAVSALSTIASQTIDASETRLYQLLLLLNTALVASGCIANSNPEECVLSPCSIIDKLCDSNFQGLPLAVNSQLQEELETLEAIFGDRFSSNFPTETLCRITIDLNPERHCDDADKMIIFISSLDNYPTRMPLIVLPKHNLNTLVDIYRQLLEEWDSIKGEVMIFHICTRVEEYIHTAADVATLNSSTIYDKLIDTVNIIGSNWNSIIDGNTDSIISVVAEELDNLSLDQTTNATNDSSSVGTSSNKTVEKRFHPFWERNKRRRTVSSRPSPEMVAFRETLPAFATRAEFLSLISSHQTMVLTG